MKKYAKEIMLVLITAIIVSVISVSATVYFNSENITFTPTNTDWNVNNTNGALNDLYSTVTTKINNFKSTIATAITDMGVITEEDADADTMANNIRSISSTIGSDMENCDILLSYTGADNTSPRTITSSVTLDQSKVDKYKCYVVVCSGAWENMQSYGLVITSTNFPSNTIDFDGIGSGGTPSAQERTFFIPKIEEPRTISISHYGNRTIRILGIY